MGILGPTWPPDPSKRALRSDFGLIFVDFCSILDRFLIDFSLIFDGFFVDLGSFVNDVVSFLDRFFTHLGSQILPETLSKIVKKIMICCIDVESIFDGFWLPSWLPFFTKID